MSIDPRTPVIVGVGQAHQRVADPTAALEPVELLATAARSSLTDVGATLTVDAVAIAEIIAWRYPDPGAILARRLGIEPRTTILTTTGGNSPQMMVNRLGAAIRRGDHDVVLLGGVECMYSRRRARRIEPKVMLDWTQPDDAPCPIVIGDARPGSSQYEMAHRVLAPTQVYPLFETALRHAAGRSVADHQHHIAAQFQCFLQVQQAAMRVDHDGLRVLAEFPAVGVLARRSNGDTGEYAGTSSRVGCLCLWHGHILMVQCARPAVNGMTAGRVQNTQFAISLLKLSKVP